MKPTTNSNDITLPHYVKCISPRDNDKLLTVGENYILDLSSVYIDSDGDSYADCYTVNHTKIGRRMLKHFQSI